ncbi:MAG: flotillin-like FloA family protein [Verrucomicrobiota bacterium]
MKYSIPFFETLMMRLRGVPVGKVKRELKKAQKHSLDVDHLFLQAHYLAGGDIEDLMNSIIFTKENGMKLNAQTACAGQLMSKYQDNISFTEKLKIMHSEGIQDADEFLTKGTEQAGVENA